MRMVLGPLFAVLMAFAPSHGVTAAASSSPVSALGQAKQVVIPENLMREIIDVLTLQGQATDDQALAREQAFLDLVVNQPDDNSKDFPGVIRAALADSSLRVAGSGQVVIAGGSSGCGNNTGTCAWQYCEDLWFCRDRFPCNMQMQLNVEELLKCRKDRLACSLSAAAAARQCNGGTPVPPSQPCGGIKTGTLSDPSFRPCSATVSVDGGRWRKCSETEVDNFWVKINSQGTAYDFFFSFTSDMPVHVLIDNGSVYDSKQVPVPPYDGCITTHSLSLSIPVQGGLGPKFRLISVSLTWGCTGSMNILPTYTIRVDCFYL